MLKHPTETQNREMYDVARRMAILAEYRDPGIAHHIDRIYGYCRVLAYGLGLSNQEAELTATASMLHDLGKAIVPFEVLQKAAGLNNAEWELVQRHPQIGADILRGSPAMVMQLGETIALTHHERWDGSGYPNRLIEEEIPLSGRICGVADVFDALTTTRPYNDQVSVTEALALIRSASGTLFDPQVVTVFERQFEELCRVRTQNI